MLHILIFFLAFSTVKSAATTVNRHNLSRRRNKDQSLEDPDLIIVTTDASLTEPELTSVTTDESLTEPEQTISSTDQGPTESEVTIASTDQSVIQNVYDITENDPRKSPESKMEEIMVKPQSRWQRYASYIAISGSVLVLAVIIYGLWRNAICCLSILFCPCSVIIFPCVYFHYKSFDPVSHLKHNANKYIPGLIIKEDGSRVQYHPTPEEMRCLADVIHKIEAV